MSVSRYFVAAVPPAGVVADLAAATAEVRALAPDLQWSPPRLWHLTLAFLGPVPNGTEPELCRRLATVAADHGPVPAAVAGGGQFGQRVLWFGVADDPPDHDTPDHDTPDHDTAGQDTTGQVRALPALAGAVRSAAERAGVESLDRRPWQPHLTLARLPATGGTDLAPLVDALGRHRISRWKINEIKLLRSEAGPLPTYTVVNGWSLTGSKESTAPQ